MFSSKKFLKRKTPSTGVDRQEFIEHLLEEYYTTTNVEAQEQVTANLANFAYDPINWNYLKTAGALKLFVELLEKPNDNLNLHGSAGLCNICLDCEANGFIIQEGNINSIKNLLLRTANVSVVINILTLFYQLLLENQSSRTSILCVHTIKLIQNFKSFYENDQRVINISSLLLDKFGKRYELVQVNSNMLLNDKEVQ